MKLFAATVCFLLPAFSWGQRLPSTLTHSAAIKQQSKQARYARLDYYAQHLPDIPGLTLEKLAASLASQARTDDDKARLIFTWLACHIAYDVAYLRGDTTHLYDPEHVLNSRKAICQGYADLFTNLATRMKLRACTVSGHAYDWLSTGDVLDAKNAHAWNAYQTADTWHFADATWGAGGTTWDNKEFEPKFDPYWFDLAPAQAILTHLPTENVWQLLPAPIKPAAFQSWPYVNPSWFQLISGTSLLRTFGTAKSLPRRLPSLEAKSVATALKVQIVQIPLNYELIAGQPVKFVFQAPPGIRLTVDLYDKLLVLQSDCHYQQATVTPTTSPLRIQAWNKADSTFICSLEYEVVPTPRQRRLQPGQHRLASADSVIYLRR